MSKTLTPRLILSPCGTSLLTNGSTETERRLLTRHANTKSPVELGADRIELEQRVANVRQRLLDATEEQAQLASAELNGILKLYQEERVATHDHHILLCTDTWLGEQTGRLVEGWLRSHGHNSVEVRRQPDLQTADLTLFQSALSDLTQWLSTIIDSYRQQQYRILFNLTGGFKSVQGFLQTLGNFYADETIYVFETAGSPLLRIPRLPVRFDILESVRQYIQPLRRLALGLTVPAEQLAGIPETFLLRLDGQIALSPWGALVWEQSRKELYGQRIWPTPTDRIAFAKTFLGTTENQPSDRLINLNDKIDKLTRYLEGHSTQMLDSLDLKSLQGKPKPPVTHEFDAWADRDAKRVYCHFEGSTCLLDYLGDALH